jgi:hypothetical protein
VSHDHVRVRQAGGQQPLLVEPCDDLRLTDSGVGNHFAGDQALRAELTRLVNDAHTAAASLTQDLVAGEIREVNGRKGKGRRQTGDLRRPDGRAPPSGFCGDGCGGGVGDQARPQQDPANERGAEKDR